MSGLVYKRADWICNWLYPLPAPYSSFFTGEGNINENRTAMANAKTKLVSRSETPVLSSKKIFQAIVPAVPDRRDAKTPALLNFFQKSNSKSAGPKEDPMPDHA